MRELGFHTSLTVKLIVADEGRLGQLIDKTLEVMRAPPVLTGD